MFEEAVFRQHERERAAGGRARRPHADQPLLAGEPHQPGAVSRRTGTAPSSSSPRARSAAGALLVHGLTDAPVQRQGGRRGPARASATTRSACGCPGTAPCPAGSSTANWEDWRAAVRAGRPARAPAHRGGEALRHRRATRTAARSPCSTASTRGGRRRRDEAAARPHRPVLADDRRLALRGASRGSWPASASIPYFERSRWLDVLPEYIPFKYDSFPAYAAQQTAELTAEIQNGVRRGREVGNDPELSADPAFVSLVDSTVETWATIDELFAFLPENGSELVLFDLNRMDVVQTVPEKHLRRRRSRRSSPTRDAPTACRS